ncbi:MAG: retropepsin-like domain-containing protein [Gemmataceae bacterium]|nr:retropepsin-like domain-containing protein [Gemmataceae bacterium]
MRMIIDELPHEIARQLHPDRRKNEEAYWAARDRLLSTYQDLWIGFAEGRVVASGKSAVAVLHEAEASGLHPFFICVGREQEPCRIRRAPFGYDAAYHGEALPQAEVEFRLASGVAGTMMDRVIPDTGADATVLPWADCASLGLMTAQGVQTRMGGLAGASASSLAFLVWARLDGRDYPCRLQADFAGTERILGRDVLNQLRILFDGPAGEVVVNP